MKTLTLYILPSDKENFPDHAAASFGEKAHTVVFLKDRGLQEAVKNCQTDWYGYLFANEYIPPELKEALPAFLESDFDVVVMFGALWNYENGEYNFMQSPRLFKRSVKLLGMMPDNLNNYRITKILNGCINGMS